MWLVHAPWQWCNGDVITKKYIIYEHNIVPVSDMLRTHSLMVAKDKFGGQNEFHLRLCGQNIMKVLALNKLKHIGTEQNCSMLSAFAGVRFSVPQQD